MGQWFLDRGGTRLKYMQYIFIRDISRPGLTVFPYFWVWTETEISGNPSWHLLAITNFVPQCLHCGLKLQIFRRVLATAVIWPHNIKNPEVGTCGIGS